MQEQVELARLSLRQLFDQLRVEVDGGSVRALVPARQRIWEALSLLDRQQEIFQPALESSNEESKSFALSQIPELALQEEVPSLVAIAQDPETPRDLAERLLQTKEKLESGLQQQTTERSTQELLSALVDRISLVIAEQYREPRMIQTEVVPSPQLGQFIRQSVAAELEQRILPHIVQESTKEEQFKQEIVDMLDERLNQRIRQTLDGSELDNYYGFVCARFTNEANKPLKLGKDNTPYALVRQPCKLHIWFQPQASYSKGQADLFSDVIDIQDGRESQEVAFQVSLDSEEIQFLPRRHTLTTRSSETSAEAVFPFAAPETPGEQEIWIQVFQNHRLIQALPAVFQILEIDFQ